MVRRYHPYDERGPRERSVGRMFVMFLLMIFVTGGLIVSWLFLADRDLLMTSIDSRLRSLLSGSAKSDAQAGPPIARYRFDNAELIAPTGLVTRIERRTLGNITKLDLLLPWPYRPGTVPKLPDTAKEFNDWIVLTFETRQTDELTPAERYGQIYPVYFDGDPEPVDGSLLRYTFKKNSPYADLTLYVANAREGEQVVHRCDRKPSVLGPILCERRIQLPGGLWLRIRFARKHLERWAEIEQNVRLALANMYAAH